MPTYPAGRARPVGMPPLSVAGERDYGEDWRPDCTANATTLAASTWTVPTGLTLLADSFTSSGLTTARLRGDTAGTYVITNAVTFANGEKDSRSMTIAVAVR